MTDKAKIIDGKEIASRIRADIKAQVALIKREDGRAPGLAVVIVGEDPASTVYVRNKVAQTTETGMNSFHHELPADAPESELLALIEKLNDDAQVNGILVQLPLPEHMNADAIIGAIDPDKDVDGFHVVNVGRLHAGLDGMVPCTPLGCVELIKSRLDSLSGAKAVIVGRSNIVGKPLAALLTREHCTVTVAHSRTRDLAGECGAADIVVAAVGVPKLVKGSWIKEGATVIDVGINRVEIDGGRSRLVGDVDFEDAVKRAGAITPVPGGVGPMTIACLLQNTVRAYRMQNAR